MNYTGLIIGAGVVGAIFYVANRVIGNSDTNKANRDTSEVTTANVQAQLLYKYMQMGNAVLPFNVVDEDLVKVYSIAYNIEDWEATQKSFSLLCGGQYTIYKALDKALTSEENAIFMHKLEEGQKLPRLYATKDTVIIRQDGSIASIPITAGYVGRVKSTTETSYIVNLDGFDYAVPKSAAVTK